MSKYNDLFAPNNLCIYTMPSGAPFLRNLAKGLKSSLGVTLPTALILLPTRRAVRALADEFVNLSDGRATLLPLMRPLADMDENEPPFTTGTIDFEIPPAIDSVRHRFELAKLVAAKMKHEGAKPDAASALAMAEPLARLLADLAMEELDVNAFSKLDEKLDTLARHFQSASEFAKIVTKYWPQYLRDNGLTEPMARRVTLLKKASELWQANPPDHPVIIAGSTGTLKATSGLIKTVAALPQGLIVLPGLDTHIDEIDVWDKIDDQHPQASLKNLLDRLEVDRADVPVWPGLKTEGLAAMRARILSHALIPANSTYDWPARIARIAKSTGENSAISDGLAGLSLIEARTSEEEATVISLIMRETLEHKDKTCALVTPDPSLARRVRAKLSRWNVEVDSTAGEPLEETGHGAFLSLSLESAHDPFDPIALSALVKHKLFNMGGNNRKAWDRLEAAALRGTRPKSFDAIAERLDTIAKRRKLEKGSYLRDEFEFYKTLHTTLSPLNKLLHTKADATILAKTHTELLETLAGGATNLWRGESGEKSAQLIEELIEYGSLLAPVSGETYARILSHLMRGRVARPRFGTVERLQILGPLEARMLEADTIILGGLNEGVWPAHPAPHPVLSPGMRKTIGLSAPERRFGLAAHDFEALAAKPHVILTRSERNDDGPTVQSRWLWRLITLVRGALGDAAKDVLKPKTPWLEWARALDTSRIAPTPAKRPAPCPPLDKRWPKKRGLSVTQIKTWIRDPYAIYAGNILGLRALDPLDQTMGGREFGLAVHGALESVDSVNAPKLAKLLKQELANVGYENHSFARMNVRINALAEWAVGWADSRKQDGWQATEIEKKARLEFPTSGAPFILTGIVDRIERKGDEAAIIDYKTGALPGIDEVQVGFDPQMPLLGVMMGYGILGAADHATDYIYVKPNAAKESDRIRSLCRSKDADEYASEAFEALQNLIAHFDKPESLYHAQPRVKFENQYGDYDHLSRRAEWAKLGDNEGGAT
ncbi:MAG: double-strand break repair protein AddB [Robiginitomaculum sp.]|nr:double-strand break repair protein AddB [Robiginitomaculum sp.]